MQITGRRKARHIDWQPLPLTVYRNSENPSLAREHICTYIMFMYRFKFWNVSKLICRSLRLDSKPLNSIFFRIRSPSKVVKLISIIVTPPQCKKRHQIRVNIQNCNRGWIRSAVCVYVSCENADTAKKCSTATDTILFQFIWDAEICFLFKTI